jgi:hypothetical protein
MRVRAVRGRFRSADHRLHVDESLQGVEAESEIIVRIGVMHAVESPEQWQPMEEPVQPGIASKADAPMILNRA